MHNPVDDSLTEGEVIASEKNVAKDDGDGSKDDDSKKTEDVFPNRGTFFDSKRMTNLCECRSDRCFFESGEPFLRMSLLFTGKRNPV